MKDLVSSSSHISIYRSVAIIKRIHAKLNHSSAKCERLYIRFFVYTVFHIHRCWFKQISWLRDVS